MGPFQTSSELFSYDSATNYWTYLSGRNLGDLVDTGASHNQVFSGFDTPPLGTRREPACYFSQGFFIVVVS